VHELGLLRSVVQAVELKAAQEGANRVEAVGLQVGTLSGAVEHALLGAWPLATEGTALANARLEIEPVQAAVWCPACAAERDIDQFFALTCPVCAAPTGQLVRGREFQVMYADLERSG
jgi:hydrogenase nickel incorporation protein HypA/HybF